MNVRHPSGMIAAFGVVAFSLGGSGCGSRTGLDVAAGTMGATSEPNTPSADDASLVTAADASLATKDSAMIATPDVAEGQDANGAGAADARKVLSDAGTTVSSIGRVTDGSTRSSASDAGNPCTNLQFNPRHCGSCGHDCMGGACQGGTCVPLPPRVLASGQLTPSSIAVDDVNVYWVNESTTVDIGPTTRAGDASFAGSGFTPTQILMCAKSGCNNNPTVIATRQSIQDYNTQRGFAVDGKNVYWEETVAGVGFPTGLFASVIGGGGHVTELRQMYNFGDIALNANQVYAIGAVIFGVDGKPAPVGGGTGVGSVGPWQVYGCSVAGCDPGADAGPNVLWSTPQSPTIASLVGLTVDTSNAYFANAIAGTILSCPLAGCGGGPTVITQDSLLADAGSLLPWQLAVNQANVYWDLTRYLQNQAGPAEGQVLACAKTGCSAPMVLASALRNPEGLATDGSNVYFVEHGDSTAPRATDGLVSKCAVAGCSNQPVVIASNVSYPHGIAVDATNVYWTDLGSAATGGLPSVFGITSLDGRIMVAPK